MNYNNSNTDTQASATSSRLETSEIENNTSNIVNASTEVHGLQAPLFRQILDNTSITIEENNTEHINDQHFANGNNSRENIMEQYARYLRQQVAEVTRGGLGNIITVTRNNNISRQNATDSPRQSETFNRMRYMPASFGGLNRVLTPESLQTFTSPNNFISTQHSNEGNSNNHVTITLSDHDSDVSSRTTLPSQIIAARTPEQELNLASYFQNDANDNVSLLPALNLINQTITSRSRVSDGGRTSIVERSASTDDANDSNDTATRGTEETATSTNEIYNNVYPDVFINTVRQCLHYIPFACILLVKFIYDHFSGLLDIIMLQFVMYYVNKSLQAQVSRIDEKKNSILLRDLSLVVATITLRLLIASTSPDPFGLLIAPSLDGRSIVHQIAFNFPQDTNTASQNQLSTTAQNSIERTVVIPKVISLVTILYYIAVNDLILKLITIAIKLIVTLIPLRTIRHKSRTRLYVFIELFSQFHRSLVPIHQWLLFLFESYSGVHAISGVMFSSAYIVLKGCELPHRGKTLKKSFFNLLNDVDKSRKPVQDDFDAADDLCAICQDSYVSPVVLECGHIFCDNCVTAWFKREQTCPMCRAKVGDNLAWHDGSTTFFYQLY